MKRLLVLTLILLFISMTGCGGGSKDTASLKENEKVEEAVKPEVKPVKEKETEKSSETLAQKNAVGKAKEYLKIMSFSKSGLIEQLEFEGFESDDARYAVNKIEVDWKEQALRKGNEYLKLMNYSRKGLIEQLEFEGFSTEEATYALDEIGL